MALALMLCMSIFVGCQSLVLTHMLLLNCVSNMKTHRYLMASTPHDFCIQEAATANATATDVNTKSSSSDSSSDNITGSDLLFKVLLPLAQELQLPIALKLGAHRGVNPALRGGGDGVVSGQVASLKNLCTRYPKVKFLATFLARVDQVSCMHYVVLMP
jgi:hypothetical protein